MHEEQQISNLLIFQPSFASSPSRRSFSFSFNISGARLSHANCDQSMNAESDSDGDTGSFILSQSGKVCDLGFSDQSGVPLRVIDAEIINLIQAEQP